SPVTTLAGRRGGPRRVSESRESAVRTPRAPRRFSGWRSTGAGKVSLPTGKGASAPLPAGTGKERHGASPPAAASARHSRIPGPGDGWAVDPAGGLGGGAPRRRGLRVLERRPDRTRVGLACPSDWRLLAISDGPGGARQLVAPPPAAGSGG